VSLVSLRIAMASMVGFDHHATTMNVPFAEPLKQSAVFTQIEAVLAQKVSMASQNLQIQPENDLLVKKLQDAQIQVENYAIMMQFHHIFTKFYSNIINFYNFVEFWSLSDDLFKSTVNTQFASMGSIDGEFLAKLPPYYGSL